MRTDAPIGRHALVLATAACLLVDHVGHLFAAVPEVSPRECVYLVGAPPGAPAATEEERDGDAGLFLVCTNPVAGGAANRDGDNMVQAWIGKRVAVPGPTSCRAFAWVSHDFRVSATASGLMPGVVRLAGTYRGVIDSGVAGEFGFSSGASLRAELLEFGPGSGSLAVVAADAVFDRAIPEGILELIAPFGQQLEGTLIPGRVYRVRLFLEVWVDWAGEWSPVGGLFPQEEVDFGLPYWLPRDRYARYDSIEVCLGEPDQTQTILGRIDDLEGKVDAGLTALDQVRADLDSLRVEVLANGEKLDRLLLLMDELKGKECEQIRLLLTPEGRRESNCCGSSLRFPDGKDAPSCSP